MRGHWWVRRWRRWSADWAGVRFVVWLCVGALVVVWIITTAVLAAFQDEPPISRGDLWDGAYEECRYEMFKHFDELDDDDFKYLDTTCSLRAFGAVEDEFGRPSAHEMWVYNLNQEQAGAKHPVLMGDRFPETR